MQPNPPTPTPTEKRKRPMWQVAALGLIGLCLALAVLSALVNPRGAGSPTPTGNQAVTQPTNTTGTSAQARATDTVPPPPPAADTNTPVPPTPPPGIGSPVEVGSWRVTAERIETVPEIEWSEFGNTEKAAGKYLLVYLNIENIANRTDSVKSFDYSLLDSGGAEYDPCSSFACFQYPERVNHTRFNQDIPPRTTVKLLAIFDVAADANGFTLVIEGTRIVLGDLP